jgi:hypothetical protein
LFASLNLFSSTTAVWSCCGYHQSSSSTSGWLRYVCRTTDQPIGGNIMAHASTTR